MPQHTDERSDTTDPKFYLPAGTTSSSVAGRLADLWAALFDHGVDAPR
jgi:hypothetical protein